VLGVGGGGCQAINMVSGGTGGPIIGAIDTDTRSLSECDVATKIQIGLADADGVGCGGDADLGKLAAEHDIEMIRGMFTDADVAVIVTCGGGGTGSGATPVVARAAREAGVFVIVLATRPFKFEGEKRKHTAERALQQLVNIADVVSLIDNDALFGAVGGDNINESFEKAADVLAAGVCSLWQILVQPSFIGIDPADLRHVAEQGSGICLFGFGDGKGATRVDDALKGLLEGPVFDGGRVLQSGRSALVCVAGGCDMTLQEAGDVMKAVSDTVPDDCSLIMGAVTNDEWVNRIMVSVFVSDRKRVVKSTPGGGSVVSGGGGNHRTRRSRKRTLQEKLKPDLLKRGRFKDVEATIMDGTDLDIPTFIRQEIEIEK
jgi:cell division protein FtsZ